MAGAAQGASREGDGFAVRRERYSRAATLALALLCALALARLVLRVPVAVPLDPNEGWNAYHAAAAMAGDDLYPRAATLYFDNYPPLSFYAVGALSVLTHDAIAAGRALSILSFLWTVAALGCAARGLGASRAHAAFACAFGAAVFLRYSHYVGIDDPQLFGHAVAATGMAALLRRPESRRAAIACGALCACALFVKPNLVALPLAMALWLALRHRRVLAHYVVSGTLAACVLLALCSVVYGSDFLTHLVSPRLYSASDALAAGLKWLAKTAAFFVPLAVVALRARDDAITWSVVYAAVSTALGLYFIGGSGVDQNVFFDVYLALALSSAVVLHHARDGTTAAAALACYLAPLAISLVLQSQPAWRDADYWIAPERRAASEFADAVAFVAGRRGPAACEEQSLCYRAGKPRAVDFVNLVQYVAKGAVDEDLLLSKIRARQFGVVQLLADAAPESALGRSLQEAYVVGRRDAWGVYYVPRLQSAR